MSESGNNTVDALADALAKDGHPDLIAEIGNAALDELLNRLRTPGRRAELPAPGLLNLATAILKQREKDDAARAQAEQRRDTTIYDVLADSKLPEQRKRQLIVAEIQRLEHEIRRMNMLLDKEEHDAGEEIPVNQETSGVRGATPERNVETESGGDLERRRQQEETLDVRDG